MPAKKAKVNLKLTRATRTALERRPHAPVIPKPIHYALVLATEDGQLLKEWTVLFTDSDVTESDKLNLAASTHGFLLVHEIRDILEKRPQIKSKNG